MSAAAMRVVAFLGDTGSLAEAACRRLAPLHDLMPLVDLASVVRAVCQGSADLGLLALPSGGGEALGPVKDLLAHPELRVIGEEVVAADRGANLPQGGAQAYRPTRFAIVERRDQFA